MAAGSERVSEMANGACLLRQVVRTWSRRFQRSGTGFKNVVGEVRIKQGRKFSTSYLIADAQSVKNSDSAGEKGYDAGKKISASSASLRSIPKVCPMRSPSRLPTSPIAKAPYCPSVVVRRV